jgi:hypothetical protein
MAGKTKKPEGPACACGRGDLYTESQNLKENEKEDVSDSAPADQADDHNGSAEVTGKEDEKK